MKRLESAWLLLDYASSRRTPLCQLTANAPAPLDDTLAGRRYARALGDLPVTHSATPRLVRPPLWFGMKTEQDKVIEATFDYFNG
jgi:hypothetical protein